jgi:glycosyltransferase involved in cell wall biosynthesis
MRILLIADPFIEVPPKHYGGIERVVSDLASGLSRRGHEVTLWAAPGSTGPGLVEPFGQAGEWTRWSNARNIATITARLLARRTAFDVVHNFGRLAYLGAILRAPVAKVQTYMRPISPRNVGLTVKFGARNLQFTAVSRAIRDTGSGGGGQWSVIYNCAPVASYPPRYDVDPATAPLAFLGRFERCKGAHTAIEVARQARRTLCVAGTPSHLAHEREYFEREVAPRLSEPGIEFVGPVDDRAKRELLGSAAALLLPIEWEEPFPVVLVEALLCGTPVIAFPRGGVPEGLEHGRTGFLVKDTAAMVDAVRNLGAIDRRDCRADAERRFSDDAIVAQYEQLYLELAGTSAAATAPARA